MSTSSHFSPATSAGESDSSKLPRREIPGDVGLPFFGPIKDRYDYFYNQGIEKFFESRIEKYNSTVFRMNVPPGPFIVSNPRVVVLLDGISFPTLFDNSRVDKADTIGGPYVPSLAFSGGYRICSHLDTTEPKHALLKSYFLSFLASKREDFIPSFRSAVSNLFINLEDQLAAKGTSNFNTVANGMTFEFLFKLFGDGRDPSTTSVKSDGPKFLKSWFFLQICPLVTFGSKFIPNFLEDLALHTFPLPFSLVKSKYKRLYESFFASGSKFLDGLESLGIKRDEACHNLVFVAGLNSFAGLTASFPYMIKRVGAAGESLHQRLRDEIRTVVKSEGGVTFSSLDKMTLMKSTVYEAFRIDPPLPRQFARARDDIVVQSHDATFVIKKGEIIFGYQPIATRDPKIFEKPKEFLGDRFVGEEGEKLLKYVYWANGREVDDPRADDKMCPGKDLAMLVSRILLVEFFLRYDTFEVELNGFPPLAGSSTTIVKSLTKATWS